MDHLPEQFDLIVVGTGLPETVLAAAASRAGKSVLQIDRNGYYGDEWASLSLEMVDEWAAKQTLAHNTGNNYNSSFCNVDIVYDREPVHEHVMQDLRNKSNRFAIDLSPRLIFSRGAMVDVLVQSNICRYLEFKNCTRILSSKQGCDRLKWVQVPSTRDAVFASEDLSLLQKRKFMKFVEKCKLMSETREEDIELNSQSFISFLEENGMDQDLIDILSAVTDSTGTTTNALRLLKRVIESSGVFGPTAYLWPLYGSGELPQAFARLSAVFGGVYCLSQEVTGIQSHEDGVTVTIGGRQISSNFVAGSVSSIPANLLRLSDPIRTSHAVLITNSSIHGTDENEVSRHLVYAPTDSHPLFFKRQITSARLRSGGAEVSLIEVGSGSQCVPLGLFLVYMSCVSNLATAKDDMQSVCDHLFPRSSPDHKTEKPRVLWSCFFNKISPQKVSCTQSHVYAFRGPSVGVDYEPHIEEAKALFHRLFPNDTFLPRAPDAEDIVLEDEAQDDDESHKQPERE